MISKKILLGTIRSAARSRFLRVLVQKTGTVVFFERIYTKIVNQEQQDSSDAPIYFLGEKLVSKNQWQHLKSLAKEGKGAKEPKIHCPTTVVPGDNPAATILVSLFKSEKYLPGFIETLKSQTIISRCQVVIVSVVPSPIEKELIRSAFADSPNIEILEVGSRIGIYEAWNLALERSRSEFITNMNVDDVRHPSSLEIQVSELTRYGVDVVFQDVYYSYENDVDWQLLSKIGVRSNLPDATLKSLARGINSPHNAPMWRKSIHSKVGRFDETFASAGDHDFWIRAALAGARFRKSKNIHVGYYINPDGMSTKLDSPGRLEGLKILKKYRRYA